MEPSQDVASTSESTERQLEILKAAATSGNENQVRELLMQKPRLDNQIGGEILWDAVLNDHLEIASMLVEAGADVNVTKPADDDWTHLLHELVISSNDDQRILQLTVLMMENRANVNAVDCYCFTPLRYAIRTDSSIGMIRELLKHGARVDSRLVFEAVDHPEVTEVMALLVTHFVKTETGNQMTHDVLYYCADIGFDKEKALSAVKLLLDMGLPIVRMMMNQILVGTVRVENLEMVQSLIELGFDVNISTLERTSPLHAASSLQRSDITELLIRAGADVNARVLRGSCAIHTACRNKSLENIKVLLRHGADVRVTDRRGRTPLSMIQVTTRITAAHRMIIQCLAIKDEKINDSDLTIIEGHVETRTFYSECRSELERMKSMKIIYDFSFYSVFRNVREVAFQARYPNFFETYNGVQRDVFPIYHDEMEFVLERAKAWKDLLSEREKATCETLKNIVPRVPLEKIILFLYLNDIE